MARQAAYPPRMTRARIVDWLAARLAIGDLPGDDDDRRLRKRAGVAAGYITVVAPWTLPFTAPAPLGWALPIVLSGYSAINLIILARTKRFERYVVALVASGPVFVFATNAVGGGVTTSGAAWVWAFLTPAYALLALGPRRATPWMIIFLATTLGAVVFDPIIRTWFPPPTYVAQLVYYAQGVTVPLTITFLLLRYTDLRRRAAEAKSDELLTNAIPAAIATRLKRGDERIAERYPETTTVFADIVGCTPWSQRTEPERVVTLLDDLFTRWDRRATELGVEKIKTVGDAYMAVSGAPEPCEDHAQRALAFARSMLQEVADWRMANDIDLQVRVGVASGPAVGGIIGRRRLLFDLWSDAVNTAARMESSGIPGRIQVAASTHALLDGVAFEERHIDVKGLGPMTTYLVVDGEGGERPGR